VVEESELFVGLMSGTSADGADAVLVDFRAERPFLLAHHHRPYPPALRSEVMALFTPGDDGIDRAFCTDAALGLFFAETVHELLARSSIAPSLVAGIGCHGQTVRHRPSLSPPFTLQLGDPNVVAERTGITTVADFRRRDMACGGQGAPLVPSFHRAIFAEPGVNRCILNLGGIANLTFLSASGETSGFDCGPGNGLLDAWCERHTGAPFDNDGQWSRQGTLNKPLLEVMSAHPFFALSPPKSTGKEVFSPSWLDSVMAGTTVPIQDVARTLVELTAWAIADSLRFLPAKPNQMFVCGGGAFNSFLVDRIESLTSLGLSSTSELGVDPQQVEAMAFAWLCRQTLRGRTSSLPAVTGASGPRILGAIYQR
jgi:anhydro-N-acetylmuramic acid kinase